MALLRVVPWFLCTLFSWFVSADLDVELYRTAKKSPDLKAVEGDVQKISEFLLEQRPSRHVALLLHDANCPHCRKALPELDLVAKALTKEAVVLGHVDCTSNKAAMRTHFNLKGFPCLLFWRKQPESLDELVGKTVVVDSDSAFLLRASRLAGLGAERDESRLALLGKEVIILQVDGKDMTVQVETETKQKVWIPHEVLIEQGRRVPYRREEAMTKYQNLWEKDLMQSFVQRAMQPLVAKLPSSSLQSLEKEDGHALVLCAAVLSRGFLEAATNYHQTLRAFHTPSCPELGSGDHILSYSPASLQWTAVPGRAKAAAAVAGKEVTSNDTHLVQWVEQHQYPGISALTIHSVHAWLRAGRPTVLLAIKLNDFEKNIMVENQLREVGKPTPVGNMELYSYGPFDRYLGVADGTLEGFNYFGVAASNLPRVVVFDDPEHWVEDEDYVTAERLSEHLPRVARMWRMSSTPRGYALWIAKRFVAVYLKLDRDANASFGYAGRCVVVGLLLVFIWAQARGLVWLVQSLLNMLNDDEDSKKKAEEKKKKKDKRVQNRRAQSRRAAVLIWID